MKKLLLALPLLVAAPLIAQQTPSEAPGKADVTRVSAGSYTTDPSHTLVSWKVVHFGFSNYFGLFGDITGTLQLDPKNIAASKVDITIPVSKVTTANSALTGHLLRAGKDGGKPDFFGPAPADAKFVSTAVKASKGGKTATITGNLTLNGITKPVTLNAAFTGAGVNPYNKKDSVGFSATATIKRSDFGIATAIPLVTDAVDLNISVAFEKAS